MNPPKQFLALFLLIYGSFSLAEKPIDFIFDIDEVLVHVIEPRKRHLISVPDNQRLELGGLTYRIADGAGELLASLAAIPGARISFFSTGGEARNLALLEKLKLPDGRSFKELAGDRVFSYQHVTLPKKRKDIRKVAPDIDLERAFLFDDNTRSIEAGQEHNLIWLPHLGDDWTVLTGADGSVVEHLEAGRKEDAKELTRTFLANRNRLARARGIISKVLSYAEQQGISPVAAFRHLKAAQVNVAGEDRFTDLDTLREGVKELKKTNPAYQFSPLFRERNCWEDLAQVRKLRTQ